MDTATEQVDSDDRARRALSFGAVAEEYDRFRPGPAPDAVDWLIPAGARRVLDIGAGTGALTRLLLGRADGVIALEPDARMRAVLRARTPAASVVGGRAEQLPFGSRCLDAVVGSSMWHWVDVASAVAEAARVLRPGGVLGVLWSGPDRSRDWLAEVLGASGEGSPEDHRAQAAPAPWRRLDLPAGAPFSEPERHVVTWTLVASPDDLAGLAETYSRVIVLPDDERSSRRARVRELVRRHPALAGRDRIELPMRAVCWRAVRLESAADPAHG